MARHVFTSTLHRNEVTLKNKLIGDRSSDGFLVYLLYSRCSLLREAPVISQLTIPLLQRRQKSSLKVGADIVYVWILTLFTAMVYHVMTSQPIV